MAAGPLPDAMKGRHQAVGDSLSLAAALCSGKVPEDAIYIGIHLHALHQQCRRRREIGGCHARSCGSLCHALDLRNVCPCSPCHLWREAALREAWEERREEGWRERGIGTASGGCALASPGQDMDLHPRCPPAWNPTGMEPEGTGLLAPRVLMGGYRPGCMRSLKAGPWSRSQTRAAAWTRRRSGASSRSSIRATHRMRQRAMASAWHWRRGQQM